MSNPSDPTPTARLFSTAGRLLLILPALFTDASFGVEMTAEEQAGQRIFNEGTGSSAITVLSGASDIQLPARSMPCARCHGSDGTGSPVGGMVPSVITWPQLTDTSGHLHDNGRQHPPFDDESLARLIRNGIDPAGNKLEPVMPRFLMSQTDMESLIAYLKHLQWTPDPGMESGRLQIATLLPREGHLAALGKEILDILQATLNLINKAGGIDGRLLKLEVADFTGQSEADLKRLEGLLQGANFALLNPFLIGIEQQGLALAESMRVPVIAPFTQEEALALDQGRYSFHLFGDIQAQSLALVDFVNQTLPRANAAAVRPKGRFAELAAETGNRVPEWEIADVPYDPATVDWSEEVRRLQEVRRSVVLFYGDGEQLLGLLQAAEAQSWRPLVLTFGSLAGNAVLEIPSSFMDRLVLAYRNPPVPTGDEKAKEFYKLRYKSDSPQGYLPSQIAAYSAVRLLEEGLIRAGRSAKREDLIQALESPQGFSLGTVPRLLYTPDRRSGAQGAHLAMVDTEKGGLRSVSLWLSLDQEQTAAEPARQEDSTQFSTYPFKRVE